MLNFVPVLQLASESPPQTSFQDKLGGLPWGLRPSLWPVCKDCGKSQTLLAQFIHDERRLDLGREGRVLNVFQCNHDPGMCLTWEGGSGANACFVVEPEDMAEGLSSRPADHPSIELEAFIVDWETREDGLSVEEAALFFPPDERPDSPPVQPTSRPTSSTRLGGVPCWIQSPNEAPKGGWQFVGQLDSTYSFLRAPAKGQAEVYVDADRWEGRSHYAAGPNFGDGGIAYLFLRRNRSMPEGWFFWQCG